MSQPGFNAARFALLEALGRAANGDPSGLVHDIRPAGKNRLADGSTTAEEVKSVVLRCRLHEERPHDSLSGVTVYILKLDRTQPTWYIKWYFRKGVVHVLSVHELG